MKSALNFVCDRLSLAIVAIGTVVMVLVFVVVENNATHIGYYPIVFNGNTDRVDVGAGTPGVGGLQTGDRIDLGALTQQQRFALLRGAPTDSTMTVRVMRGGRFYMQRLTASGFDNSPRARLTRDVGIPLSFFLSLALASALFLLRPRPITLAFYFYTMLMLVKTNQTALDLASWPISVASDMAIQVVYPLAQLMILIFAQRLYGRPSRAWPLFFGSALVLSLVVFLVWLDPIVWMVFQRYGIPGPTQLFMSLSDVLLLVVVLCGLAYIASGATGLERRRVTWVIAGIALAPILDFTWAIANVLYTIFGSQSTVLLNLQHWTDALGPWFGLAGSAFVVYGFLSERVIDFRFVIGRAAIYGSITAVLLLLFGILEWWAEQLFESTRPAIYLSLFAALFIGFALNAIHGRVEDFLNTFFFRDQRRAEEALRTASKALANTSSEKTLIDFLVDEPVRVLGLTSAALFLANREDGVFERTADRGWNRNEAETIDREDPLIVELRAELAPIVLDGRPRAETILPGGEKAPSLVVPLVMRGAVFGFVLYGARRNGLPLTADERGLLEAIARSAGAAYDHIDADKSRARIVELEAKLHELGAS
ncbi:MAG: GAF domain-containing protein [Candidatus Eremiobacteraeota bacterium]|nr:GAF domain-containing protein [Candidatus Eremiobacteraeota bacterium]MBV8499685.1 GAF domain-containing protein [Candidatus Eremiobacteraeota bacterium]